jgi:hypothetical protein
MKKLSLFLVLVFCLASQSIGAMRYTNSFASLTNAATATSGTPVTINAVESYSVYWTNTMGTPNATVTCIVEQSPDGTNWFTVDSTLKNTSNTTLRHVVSNTAGIGRLVRARTASSTRVTANVTIYTGSTR